jgi:hypothetical protein
MLRTGMSSLSLSLLPSALLASLPHHPLTCPAFASQLPVSPRSLILTCSGITTTSTSSPSTMPASSVTLQWE